MTYSASTDIEIANHFVRWGLNLDTIWTTVVAGLIVVISGVIVSRKATAGVPSGPQLLWETVVGAIQDQVEASLGKRIAPFVVPLAVALFTFILIANWLEIIPTHGALSAPTGDVNLTFAMAVFVVIWVHAWGAHHSGKKNYWGHVFNPKDRPIALRPFNVIEELVRPVSLALRLFGNIFAGGIMIELIGLFPAYLSWAPNVLWKLFDMFIGVIQAAIFALLTILYFSFANVADHAAEAEH
jgi:F-type H+-transporting ATPase subunit a